MGRRGEELCDSEDKRWEGEGKSCVIQKTGDEKERGRVV